MIAFYAEPTRIVLIDAAGVVLRSDPLPRHKAIEVVSDLLHVFRHATYRIEAI